MQGYLPAESLQASLDTSRKPSRIHNLHFVRL